MEWADWQSPWNGVPLPFGLTGLKQYHLEGVSRLTKARELRSTQATIRWGGVRAHRTKAIRTWKEWAGWRRPRSPPRPRPPWRWGWVMGPPGRWWWPPARWWACSYWQGKIWFKINSFLVLFTFGFIKVIFSVCGKKFPDCSRLSQPLEITITLEYVYLNLDFNKLTKKAYYQRWARVFFFLAHCSTILYLKMTENLSRNFARTRNSVEKRTDSQVSSSTLPEDDWESL